MPTNSSIHFVREPVLSRKRFVERAAREQPLDQYLESLSLRHAKRTGMPLKSARKCVEAVAISARKRHEGQPRSLAEFSLSSTKRLIVRPKPR